MNYLKMLEVVDLIMEGGYELRKLKLPEDRDTLKSILDKVFKKGRVPENKLLRYVKLRKEQPSVPTYFLLNAALIDQGIISKKEVENIHLYHKQLAYVKRNLDFELGFPTKSLKSTIGWWNVSLECTKQKLTDMINEYVAGTANIDNYLRKEKFTE